MVHPLDETLARLIAPMSVERFKQECWQKRAVRIPGKPGKFARYFDEERWRADPPRHATASYVVEVDGVRSSREMSIEAAQQQDLYDAGLAIMGHVTHIPELAALLDDLRASFQVPTRGSEYVDTVLCFRSRDNIGWSGHWDVYHVFVLQISGRKRWRYSRTPVTPWPDLPPAAGAPGEPVGTSDGLPVLRPRDDELEDVVLSEGDCFYMPPGTWHAPIAVGESCHLAVAIGQLSVLDLLLGAVRDHLVGRAEWRTGVPAVTGPGRESGQIPPALVTLFAERMAALARELTVMDPRLVHQNWAASAAVHAGGPTGPNAAPVQPHERLRRATRAPIRYVLGPSAGDPGATEVYLYSGQAAAALPDNALTFVKALMTAEEFTAKSALDWDPELKWTDVQVALTALVNEGILQRA